MSVSEGKEGGVPAPPTFLLTTVDTPEGRILWPTLKCDSKAHLQKVAEFLKEECAPGVDSLLFAAAWYQEVQNSQQQSSGVVYRLNMGASACLPMSNAVKKDARDYDPARRSDCLQDLAEWRLYAIRSALRQSYVVMSGWKDVFSDSKYEQQQQQAEEKEKDEKKDGKKDGKKDAIPGWVMPVAISVSTVIILGLIVMLIVRRRSAYTPPTREEILQVPLPGTQSVYVGAAAPTRMQRFRKFFRRS